jgi:hypothetical protein
MTFPVRGLAEFGIVTDLDAYDLPLGAWSRGVNVRFRNKKITRAPVFRNVATLGSADPRFVVGSSPTSGLDLVFVCYKNGRVVRFASGIETDYSITGYADASSEGQWTSTHLADVEYVNREDRVPWCLKPSDTHFNALGGWDSTWRAKLLRVCGGALVALNVTKGSTAYPTLVKTSSFALAGDVPSSWDHTDLATNATENILAEMRGQITDAQSLGSALCIYGTQDTVLMRPVGAGDLFAYDTLPFSKGAISNNCSVEITGKNYVFGPDDIWMHDGVSEQSICDEKTRDFIFQSLNLSKANRCHVTYNARLKELSFNYVSGDEYVKFSGEGCNRAAVFSLVNGTWTFDDLPLVFAGARVNLDQSLTYATATQTYEEIGSTYLDLEDGLKKALVYVGEANATAGLSTRLYAFDQYGEGSQVTASVDEAATKGSFLERMGMDLDDVGAELRGHKLCNSIFPQARLGADAAALIFEIGAADYFSQEPTWAPSQTYDGAENYKLDFGISGRWLAMRITFPDYKEMTLTGFDFDLDVLGET